RQRLILHIGSCEAIGQESKEELDDRGDSRYCFHDLFLRFRERGEKVHDRACEAPHEALFCFWDTGEVWFLGGYCLYNLVHVSINIIMQIWKGHTVLTAPSIAVKTSCLYK